MFPEDSEAGRVMGLSLENDDDCDQCEFATVH